MIESKSRWGYHPASYQTYCKLKKLHAAYWESKRLAARYKRWKNKLPQNRYSPEPLNPLIYDSRIVALYHRVRHPSPEPLASLSSTELDYIDRLYLELEIKPIAA